MEIARPELENAFWRFSLAVYAATGVEEECLLLQEKYGIDVNLLLFCAWVGTQRDLVLSPADIAGADAVIQAWRKDIVRPLRSVRRALKPVERRTGGLRTRVKAIELEAEQIEQAMLYDHARTHWLEGRPANEVDRIAENVGVYLRVVIERPIASDDSGFPKKLIDATRRLAR